MIFAMLPGDSRQTALAALLRADGHGTPPYAPGLAADFFIFPLPTGAHPALSQLPPGSRALVAQARGAYPGLTLLDYYADEVVQIQNAVITAEGALEWAMTASDRTIHGACALVTGYGRIGRALADRLRALGATVTVYARKAADRAWAAAAGCETLSALPDTLDGFDYVFNTVPAPIILSTPQAVCLELASSPGGFVHPQGVLPAGGLPGKTAPYSAALALRDAIYRVIKEEPT